MKQINYFLLVLVFVGNSVCSQESFPFMARAITNKCFLNYGLGEDRLGAAKMGYIDADVLVKVVSKKDDLYQVELKENLSAWVLESNLKVDEQEDYDANYLSGSIKVFGDDKRDYVTISLPEKLAYTTYQETNPSAIVVDIYQLKSNTNWITHLKTAKEVESVTYKQIENDLFRLTIKLKHKQHWGYTVSYKNKSLEIAIKHVPIDLHIKGLKIAIDAGHGGSNRGAVSVSQRKLEKDINLIIALKLQKMLIGEGVKVVMTRSKDTLISNQDRILFLEDQNPDVLISIHNNSSSKKEVRGTSTYYHQIGNKVLSQKILDELLLIGLPEFGNVGAFNFALNSPTQFPNVLVEGAFMSNLEDESLLINNDFQYKIAKAIKKGLIHWLQYLRQDKVKMH
ncbi:N-acetylmuramoyl-L-alanine amidase [Flavobacterium sp.]|jgi:N-acetylmuramoyl-L-alanine amidase|uniref:N-acetylmuramoyl-L-alanine amidase n=1 Tax=Flavobacterium sp. TaxID=239 RepID=UPI0037C13206